MPIRIFICGFKFSYLDRGPLPDWCELFNFDQTADKNGKNVINQK